MTTFHAQRQIVEHPARLFDHLNDCGIALREIGATWVSGQNEGIGFSLLFMPKRFRSNLCFRVEFPKVSIPKNLSEDEARAVLAEIRRPLKYLKNSSYGLKTMDPPIRTRTVSLTN